MKRCLIAVLIASQALWCRGDAFVLAPPQTPLRLDETGTIFPFLIKQLDKSQTGPKPTMRYQQIYNAALFTNLDPGLIYVTTLTFFPNVNAQKPVAAWMVPNMQVNLSTTAKSADSLSLVFSENIGADDAVVFGPGSWIFPANADPNRELLLFKRPFRYDPKLGNLLLDVRILDGSGPPDPINPSPELWASNSTTDVVSRVWSTNVTALTASGSDTTGLFTQIALSPIPSLQSHFYPSYAGNQTNIVIISWPPQPTNFVIQRTDSLKPAPLWQSVTNRIFGDPNPIYPGWAIIIPAGSAGSSGFYRLVWPSGVGQVQPALSPTDQQRPPRSVPISP